MHCTSVGKAILAYLPRAEVEKIVQTMSLYLIQRHTITNKETLYKHLSEVREQGYALDLEENEWGINCIAAPVLIIQEKLLRHTVFQDPKCA